MAVGKMELERLVVPIVGDAKPFIAEGAKVRAEIRRLDSEFVKLNKSIGRNIINPLGFAARMAYRHFGEISRQADSNFKKVARSSEHAFRSVNEDLRINRRELGRTMREVDHLRREYHRLERQIRAAQAQSRRGFSNPQRGGGRGGGGGGGGGMGSALGGIAAGLTVAGATHSVVDAVVQYEKLDRSLTAVMGSAEAAHDELKELKEVAKLPGLGFKEAVQGSAQLQAVGFSAKFSRDMLLGFGNAIAMTGGGKADLERVVIQLQQMRSSGTLLMSDFRPVMTQVPIMAKVVEKAFGTMNLDKLRKQGVTPEVFLRKVTDELLKLNKVVGGVGNDLENASDAWFLALKDLTTAAAPMIHAFATMITDYVAPAVTYFSELPVPLQQTAMGLGLVAGAAGPLSLGIGLVTSGVRTLINLLPSLGTLWAVAWPVATVAAIGAIAYAIYQNNEHVKKFNEEIERGLILTGKMKDVRQARLNAGLERSRAMPMGPTKMAALQGMATSAQAELSGARASAAGARARANKMAKDNAGWTGIEGLSNNAALVKAARLEAEEAEARVAEAENALKAIQNEIKAVREAYGEMGTAAKRAAAEQAEAAKKADKVMMKEAASVAESVQTPFEQYRAEMQKLQNLMSRGFIDRETFARAAAQARENLNGATAPSPGTRAATAGATRAGAPSGMSTVPGAASVARPWVGGGNPLRRKPTAAARQAEASRQRMVMDLDGGDFVRHRRQGFRPLRRQAPVAARARAAVEANYNDFDASDFAPTQRRRAAPAAVAVAKPGAPNATPAGPAAATSQAAAGTDTTSERAYLREIALNTAGFRGKSNLTLVQAQVRTA
jgi:tape measure domain-containing protein